MERLSIPTDDALADGSAVRTSPDDFTAAHVPDDDSITRIGKRTKRVRGPDGELYTREEAEAKFPGFTPTRRSGGGGSRKNLDEETEKIRVRKARIERYENAIRTEVNPYLLDIGSMITGIPKQVMVKQSGDQFILTPLGEQIAWNNMAVHMHATTIARLYETERGQQIIETFEGASPYLFLGVSVAMLLFWFMGMVSLRQMQVSAIKNQMGAATPRPEGEQQNGQPAGGFNIQDMIQRFMSGGQKQPAQSEEPVVDDPNATEAA